MSEPFAGDVLAPLPGAWCLLIGLWKIPLPIARHWWEAILESRAPALAPVPFTAIGPCDVTPVTLLRQTLRLWSGESSALAAVLERTITPVVVIESIEQLYREHLFTRREASRLEEFLLQAIDAQGQWK
jgi:hypothetical protein